MSQVHGTVWWSELMTRDVSAARAWYESVCGWQVEPMPMENGEYLVCSAHGKPVAGIMNLGAIPGMDGVPPHWFTYLAVDDLDVALKEATDGGGAVAREPFDVPDVGRIAIVTDPTGASLGLIKPVTDWGPPETGSGSLDNVPV